MNNGINFVLWITIPKLLKTLITHNCVISCARDTLYPIQAVDKLGEDTLLRNYKIHTINNINKLDSNCVTKLANIVADNTDSVLMTS